MAKHTFLIALLAAFPVLAASPADHGIPLFFVANDGQTSPEVRFMAKGSGLTAYFLKDEAVFRTFGSSIRMRLEGANPKVRIEGANPLAGRVNFFTGGEENWHAGLPMYGAVAYRDLYAGIDMVYGGSGRNLKSEFLVAPGADPSQIRVRYVGAGEVRIDADGALAIAVNGEILRERAPEAYQTRGGKRVAVKSRFQASADGVFGFAIGSYDRSLPLVIDPVLSYSTFLGGSGTDAANALAVDATGAAYVAGFTASFDLPTLNPVQAANGGGNDVFVAKLNSTGNGLVYCTYLGGTGDDRAFGIAVDSTGAAYVTGWTQSANFPVRNALQASLAGGQNAFVAKLTPAGNGLAYSTFLGGKSSDSGNGIAVDSGGNVYIVGDTTSANFPVSASGFQKTYHGGQDAFVAKVSSSGATLVYSTYIGGGNFDHGAAIAVDASGTTYITGSTSSTDFPLASAFQGINGGGQNAFITRLSAAGTSLVFSTFLGGSGGRTGYPEAGQGIALDSTGNAYIAGVTSSANFPLMNPAQSTLNGSTDAFIAKMSAAGALVYSTYLGGSGLDSGNAIAVDSSGNAYIGGYTYSVDLPVVSPIQSTIGSVGSTDAFVGKLSPAGNSVSFLTYLGGNDSDTATGIAVDSSGNIYVAGWTLSANFPVLNAYQTSNAGNYGAFVTKYVFSVSPVNVSVTPNSGGGTPPAFSFQYSDANGASDLTAVGALFNTSSSLIGGCAAIYNRTQNTLALLTDTGAQPATSLTPGSGTQQNSQCVLSGGGSSVSLSGNLLTLNLAITFQGAFAGTKNIYMQAANPFQITAWQAEGTWGVLPAIAMTVTPASGNTTQQTFNFQVNDSFGATDLTSIGALFNSSISTTGACSVTYTRAQNTLALLTDAGAQPAGSIAPGSGTQQNSQCVLNGAGSSVSVAGNLLTLNLALSFQPAFGGTKNIYMDAVSRFGTLNWTQEGTWTSPPVVTMAVSPSSGNAIQQTFSVQVSDSTGAADLTTAGVLFNATASTVAGCAINYNQAQNTLALLTDAGGQPAASITPGSGMQQNSQCVLNGAASSVASSGNVLTLNLAVAFQPAFGGSKNVYVQAANPYETVNLQLEGTWSSPPVVTLAVTPSSGTGTSQRFTFQATDSLAATDLTTVGVLFNSTASTTSGCAVIYNRVLNTLALLTDGGAQPANSITPGSGTQQNSQCVLSGSGSSVTAAGNTLTLNLQIAFLPALTGTKNIYIDAANPYETVNWQVEGTWVVASSSLALSVTPSSGNATQQTFSLTVSDPQGAADLTTVGLLFNSSTSTASACAVLYNRAQNTLALLTDAGAQPAGSLSPGSGTQQNSQCVLNGGGSNVAVSGNVLALNLAVSFQPGFSGTKSLYAEAIGVSQTMAWQQEGIWTSPPVVTMAVTPSAGGGQQQKFVLQVTDSLAGTDLTTVGTLIGSTASTAGACAVIYNSAQNSLALLTDAGAQPASSIGPGTGSQQNSQCVLNGGGSSVSTTGNTLTLSLALTFQAAFIGQKNIYMDAANPYETVSWQAVGTWALATVPAISVTPTSGIATQQTFSLQVTDALGAADLITVGILFNSSTSTAGACAITYNRVQNALMLLTDAGAQPASAIAPGSGTQQNSQCVLNGAGSSVSASGNTLTLNLAIGFQPAFSGTKNLYAEAIGTSQTVNWQQQGTWASPPVVTMAVTPSSGAGTQQRFSFQVTDSLAGGDLTTVGVLFNATASTTGACSAIYNSAQNTLMLLTDAGALPASSITPGSATQQNSQCVLSGSGSSVTLAGNVLTLNLALTFLPAFAGAKNVYMDAANPYETLPWQAEGTWVTSAADSIWPATAIPANPWQSNTSYTLGVKFQSDVSGNITGVRFYKGAGNNGTHIGLLYNSSGTLLAQATFSGETASGWQQVNFSTPVEIAANTVYVAAYFSTTGYAIDGTYFASAGTNNAPLHALQNGVPGPNGVYAGGTAPQFPATGYGANYWADVVFSPAGTVTGSPDLTITSSHTGNFTQGQIGATYAVIATNSGTASTSGAVTVTESLPAAGLTAFSMLGNNWNCTQPAGPCTRSDGVAAGLSYNPITVTVNVSSTAPASVTNAATVSGGGEINTANDQATDPTTIASVATGTATSIWQATAVPGTPWQSDTSYTLGVKFQSDVSGNISGVRFYKGAGNNGTHIGLLYNSGGTLLAQAAFSGETASGWQQANFSTPVAIAANTVYVAAYFSTTGYAIDSTYFAGTGVNNAPLHALQNGVPGPDGVYAGGTTPQFPTIGYGANYWADVVFSPAGTLVTVTGSPDLTIASSHAANFTQGQNGATYTVIATNSGTASSSGTVTVTESLPATGLTAIWMLGNNWNCTQPAGPCTRSDALAAGLSYDPITVTVNVSSTAPASATNTVTVSGGGEINSANDQATDPTTIAGITTGTATSIWPATAVPGTPWQSNTSYTLGVKFQSDVSGNITGVRFYKGAGNNGTHIGLLYNSSGTLLAQAAFSGETASGWQQVNFSTPVEIAANTVYVAAYFSTTGFAWDQTYFAGTGVDNAPLHALQNGVSGPDGVYAGGTTPQFPATGYGANYWADVVFSPAGTLVTVTGSPDLTITSSHTGNFTQGQVGATYTIAATNSGTASSSGVVTVTETLPATGLTAIWMLGNNWNCTQPAGPCTRSDALAAGLSYDPITVTVNVSSTAPASATNTVTVSGGGEINSANDQATDPTTIAGITTGTATSIWPATAVPGTPWQSNTSYTLGVKFQSDVSGNITGVRFYKGAGNNGTHIGLLYDSSGTLLAQAAFSGETASGWQQVNFSTPVAIAANTVYVAAYFSTTGFAWDQTYFAGTGVDNAPLHALQNGVSGPDGVYAGGTTPQFPTIGYGANYWADVVFSH
jgi:hypothetical protein